MISGIGSSTMASQLFSRLDTSSKGYLEKSDLTSAFSKISSNSSSSSSTSVDDVFAALDSDSDGKVTESEFSSTLAKLQEQLESNFRQSQTQGSQGGHGGHGGMGGPGGAGGPQGAGGMPPPPPANDQGFTQDELKSQLDEIGSSDSQRSSLISKIVDNFSAADSDSDGKVTFQEAMAYDQSTQSTSSSGSSSTSTGSDSSASSSSSSSASSSSSTTSASNSEQEIMFKIMQLMHAYGRPEQSSLSSLLSVSA